MESLQLLKKIGPANQDDNSTLIFILIGAAVFFLFIMPMIDKKHTAATKKLKENLENTKQHSIDTNVCSRQCCKFTQWPLPTELQEKGDMTKEELDKYIGSNFSCNYGQGNGCVCFTKDDYKQLSNRGSNAGNS